MPEAVILSGAGPYSDPAHPFAETSQCLARLAAKNGWAAVVTEDIDAVMAEGLDGVDLIIVNAGAGEAGAGPHTPPEASTAGFGRALDRGISLLAMHCAIRSLPGYPRYHEALGGEWVPGRSWHAPVGELLVRPLHDAIVEGLCDFHVTDERLGGLRTSRGIEALAATAADDQVVAWAHRLGPARVVYSGLGHDARSYESAGHKSFLGRALCWLQPLDVFGD